MKASRVLFSLLGFVMACSGDIKDAHSWGVLADDAAQDDAGETSEPALDASAAADAQPAADGGASESPAAASAPAADAGAEKQPSRQHEKPAATSGAQTRAKSEPPAPSTTVGSGDIAKPALGPAPAFPAKLEGAPFVLVKNWDFGTNGTIRNVAELEAEFQFHDQWNTIANGSSYGAVTVATSAQTAIGAAGLGLPNDRQPIEDPAHPTREWTADSLLAHVRPLSPDQHTVSAARHDAGNGSFTAKWSLPTGGALLGHDLVWETRVRMPKPVLGYWYALWTAGKVWNRGAEVDVLESFGAPHIGAQSFHTDSIGGLNAIDYQSWPNGLSNAGVPGNDRGLSDWHTWTWVYLRDDSYEVYYDGYRVQHGTIHWTSGGQQGGQQVDLWFLFDFGWGHTMIADVNIEVPASMFPLTYEIDYSRVYMR